MKWVRWNKQEALYELQQLMTAKRLRYTRICWLAQYVALIACPFGWWWGGAKAVLALISCAFLAHRLSLTALPCVSQAARDEFAYTLFCGVFIGVALPRDRSEIAARLWIGIVWVIARYCNRLWERLVKSWWDEQKENTERGRLSGLASLGTAEWRKLVADLDTMRASRRKPPYKPVQRKR
jgi:hypothetical protein